MEADAAAWNFFEDILPPEVTMGVFSFLELEDVVYVALVCKTWNTYFDTKNIWKHIYEKKFGHRDEKTVNPEQNVRWKRLFLQASNLNQKWKRDFSKAQRTFRCYAYSSDQFVLANRYHGMITAECVALVDTRLAGKIVQVKHNPVTCYHHNSSGINAVTSMIKSLHDPKPPKEDVYTVPRHFPVYLNQVYRLNARDFMLHESGTFRVGIWNTESHVLEQNKTSNTMLMLSPSPEQGNYMWCVNSKFAAFNNRYVKARDVHIIDLSKKCSHCSVATLKNGDYVSETLPDPCQGFGRSPDCAIIERLNGPFDWIYASEFNPNILVMAYYNRMVIWKHGEASIEVKLPDIKGVLSWGEHLVEGKGHWLKYSTTYGPNLFKTTFMDLNNVTNKIDMPLLTKYLFVPKKSKVLCVVKDKIIAYDLDQKTWLSKIHVPKPVRAMTFSKSAAILFVATEYHIYAYQWETAELLSLIEHGVPEVIAIHLVLDQVLVISAQRYTDYYKIMTKLDF